MEKGREKKRKNKNKSNRLLLHGGLEFGHPSVPFAVMTWYRPPDSSIDLFRPFEELTGKLDPENIEYYVLGDLNCNMAAPKFDNSTNILSNIAEVYSLDQLITEYTRITEKSSTLTDLIFTNSPDRVRVSLRFS